MTVPNARRKTKVEREAEQIANDIRRITRMVGYPIPEALRERLGEQKTALLSKILDALDDGTDYRFLQEHPL